MSPQHHEPAGIRDGMDRPFQRPRLETSGVEGEMDAVASACLASTHHAITVDRVRSLFGGAYRLSHAALARALRMRKEMLQREGDLGTISFALTPTGRRLYTEAAVLGFLNRRDDPPPRAEPRIPGLARRRARVSSDPGALDFQRKLAARRSARV